MLSVFLFGDDGLQNLVGGKQGRLCGGAGTGQTPNSGLNYDTLPSTFRRQVPESGVRSVGRG